MEKINYGFEKLKEHIGHEIECVGYFNKENELVNVSIECADCCEVIIDYDKYEENWKWRV